MKDLIVYYSLEGNTEYVANRIKAITGADILKLVPRKAYSSRGFLKFLRGGKSAIAEECPKLEEYDVELSSYDRIILGFPVWAGRVTPPLRTFIEDNREMLKGKRFVTFACQSGSGAEKAFVKLAECIGIDGFDNTAIFIDPKSKKSVETDNMIDAFANELL